MTHDQAIEAVGKELYGDRADSGNRLKKNIEHLNDKCVNVPVPNGSPRMDRSKWAEVHKERAYLMNLIWFKMGLK